ncbi:U4/U6 small nuclear ribonucleoprotein prp4, partial [Coemansia asiatica]
MDRNLDVDHEEGEIVLQTAGTAHADQSRDRSPKRTTSRAKADDSQKRTTVNKTSASLEAKKQENKEYVFDSPIVKDDDAEVDRLREERRRRRNQIIEKYSQALNDNAIESSNSSSPKTSGNSAQKLEPELELERRGEVASTSGGTRVSAAKYDQNADPNADDLRRRMALEMKIATKSTDRQGISSSNGSLNAKNAGKSNANSNAQGESDDEFDMFADDDDDEEAAIAPEPRKVSAAAAAIAIATAKGSLIGANVGVSLATASTMVDNWDDPEGYYRMIVGELLDGRYLVQSLLGQGVFSSVVKAVDKQNNDAPVAIKII